MGILGCVEQTRAVRLGIVAMLGLASAAFALGLATLVYVMSTEIPAQRLRDQFTRLGFGVKVATKYV